MDYKRGEKGLKKIELDLAKEADNLQNPKLIPKCIRTKHFILVFILFLIITSFFQWAYVIIQEWAYESITANKTDFICQVNKATNVTDFTNFELILFPLAIEYRICCAIELIIMFCECKYDVNSEHKSSNKETIANNKIWFYVSLIMIIVVVSFIMYQFNNALNDHFEELANTNDNFSYILNDVIENSSRIASEAIEMLISLIVIVVNSIIIFDCKCICKCKCKCECKCECNFVKTICRMKTENKIDFGFLVFVFIFVLAYFVFQCIGLFSIWDHDSTEKVCSNHLICGLFWTSFIAEFLSVLTCAIQILGILKLLNSEYEATWEITVLIFANLLIWILDSLSAKETRTNPFMIRHFEKDWHLIDPIVVPFTIFYYFHASVILIKKIE